MEADAEENLPMKPVIRLQNLSTGAKGSCPRVALEASQSDVFTNDEWALDEISVGRKKFECLLSREAGKLVFDPERPVVHAGGVPKFAQIPIHPFQCRFEFGDAGWGFADGLELVGNSTGIEPFDGIAASAAFLIDVNGKHPLRMADLPTPDKACLEMESSDELDLVDRVVDAAPPTFPLMKTALLDQIRTELRSRLERLSRAAMEAHAAATDPGSKAEGKYDTRSLEASYLAVGQAKQVDELAEAVRIFDALVLPDFDMDDRIDAGALVEAEVNDETAFFLLVPTAGGMVISHADMEVTLLTPSSALYQKLLGLGVGDALDDPPLRVADLF
jgi:hypothetical protein